MCFRFRSFPFPSTFFRPFPFRFWLLGLCFFLSSFFPSLPHSGFSGAPFLLSLLWLSPFFPTWFPVSSFPVLCTRLSVSFLSSLPVSLPQLFHRCFPFAFAFGLSPHLAFFRPLSLGSYYSAFRSFFSLLPVFPCRRFLRCCLVALRLPRFSSSVWPVAMPYFRLWYSAYCASFRPSLSRLTVATSAPWPSLAGFGLFPFAYALGSGYSASGFLPFGFFLFAVSLGNV